MLFQINKSIRMFQFPFSLKLQVGFYGRVFFCEKEFFHSLTVALGDVVALEFLPPGTAAWLCTKDKYNLQMFSYVCQAETNAQYRTECLLLLLPATILPNALLCAVLSLSWINTFIILLNLS